MEVGIRISPKYLALTLGVPGYLFSDLSYIIGIYLDEHQVKVDDPSTPSINGVILAGDFPGYQRQSPWFLPRQRLSPPCNTLFATEQPRQIGLFERIDRPVVVP